MMLMEMLTELDSHGNQCVLGNNTLVVYNYKKPVNIVGYEPKGPVSRELHTANQRSLGIATVAPIW
jgi:hypothetical protein